MWPKRKQTLLWIKLWKLGYDVNELRLQRACVRHNLKSPEEYDKKKLEEEIEVTLLKLEELAKVAPKLRKKFLLQTRKKTEWRGNKKKMRRLWDMIVRKA